MMTQEISLTFGPLEELKKIIADHSDRQFKLFLETDSNSEYMLLDYSGKKTIFPFRIKLHDRRGRWRSK